MSSLPSPIPSSATTRPPKPPKPPAYNQEITQAENMNWQPENVGGAAAPPVHDDDNSAYFNSFPPGYRFCPRDYELIDHYLMRKVLNKDLPMNRIRDVELSKHDPEHLAKMYAPHGEREWYFFTPRDRKYKNGLRPNRAAGNGYWKATGADKIIYSNKKLVGFRKALVFYRGKAPKGFKSPWIMHEFRIMEGVKSRVRRGPNDMQLDEWVLCKIYKKPEKASKKSNDTKTQEKGVDLQSRNGVPSVGYGNFVPADTPNKFNLPEMVCSYDDYELNNYMALINNQPSVDEFNHSLQYNLLPLPTEEPCHHLYTNHNVSFSSISLKDDSITVERPTSLTTPPPVSTYQPSSTATGPANDDKEENLDFVTQLDFYNNYFNGCNFEDIFQKTTEPKKPSPGEQPK